MIIYRGTRRGHHTQLLSWRSLARFEHVHIRQRSSDYEPRYRALALSSKSEGCLTHISWCGVYPGCLWKRFIAKWHLGGDKPFALLPYSITCHSILTHIIPYLGKSDWRITPCVMGSFVFQVRLVKNGKYNEWHALYWEKHEAQSNIRLQFWWSVMCEATSGYILFTYVLYSQIFNVTQRSLLVFFAFYSLTTCQFWGNYIDVKHSSHCWQQPCNQYGSSLLEKEGNKHESALTQYYVRELLADTNKYPPRISRSILQYQQWASSYMLSLKDYNPPSLQRTGRLPPTIYVISLELVSA